jgi:uncharacterized membrane protein
MIGPFLAWWLVSSVLGLITVPITWRVFSRLPDRGYGFSRALGLMAASYIFWLSASIGVLKNSLGGVLISILILVCISLWMGSKRWKEIRLWLRTRWRTILVMELLFIAAFGLWTFVRAYDPNITHTEQRMELAFLNSILSSKSFPPRDPWLSGYAISYYYFGYIQMALLTQLTGVAAGVAFNLTNSMWFALSALGTYALLYNLLSHREGRPILAASFLGPLFVLISGNIEGFLEFLHARQIFWRQEAGGAMVSSFWKWLDLKNLVDPPMPQLSWIPTRNWWWWRASRVVNDVNLAGISIEVIDEFPFFSFLLADNHPHLLALPFVLIAVGFALQIYLSGVRGDYQLSQVRLSKKVFLQLARGALLIITLIVVMRGSLAVASGMPLMEAITPILKGILIGAFLIGLLAVFLLLVLGYFPSAMSSQEFWFGAWLFGGLLFLNTWDFPIYLILLLAVILWGSRSQPLLAALKRLVITAIGLTVAAVLFYILWYPTFTSQAGGILPNLIFPTRLPQFLVMFATAFVPIVVWLARRVKLQWKSSEVRWLVIIGLGLPLALLIISLMWGGIVSAGLRARDPATFEAALSAMGARDVDDLVGAIQNRRVTHSWTAIVLGMIVAASIVLLRRGSNQSETAKKSKEPAWPFVVLLAGLGALLILGPEFLYLKDQFNTRMNTIFKFYFSAWIIWGVAAAYATYELWPKRWSLNEALRVIVIIPLILGFFYPFLSTWTKTNQFNPSTELTLDGTDFLAQYYPSDYDAIQWINDNSLQGVVSEAIGGSYTYFARISTHTALDTVLGWPGHESQWRNGYEEQGSRNSDIQKLYQSRDWDETKGILDLYQIDYVYVGPLERTTFEQLIEDKFEMFMDEIFHNNEVRIFARRYEAAQ